MKIHNKYFFIITGIARSGTTYLSNLYNSHPECVSISDPINVFFKAFINEINFSLFGHYDSSLKYPIPNGFMNNYLMNYFHTISLNRKIHFDHFNDYIYAIANNCENFTPNIANRIRSIKRVDNFKDLFLELLNCMSNDLPQNITHFGIKTAWSESLMPTLLNTFPTIRVVHIIRDPRAVITSNYKTNNKRYPLLYNIRDWRKSVYYYYYLRKEFPENYKMIKYEDLLIDHDKFLSEILDFVNLQINVDLAEVKNTNSSYNQSVNNPTEYINRWKNNLPENLSFYIEKTCFPEMRKIIYLDDLKKDEILPQDGLIEFDSLSEWCKNDFNNKLGVYINWIQDQNILELLRMDLVRRKTIIDKDIANSLFFDYGYYSWLNE